MTEEEIKKIRDWAHNLAVQSLVTIDETEDRIIVCIGTKSYIFRFRKESDYIIRYPKYPKYRMY